MTSDKDWDEEHPAGIPLDDLLLIEFKSHAGFIRSGYVDHSQYEREMKLSELTSTDLAMLNADSGEAFVWLFFLKAPDEDTAHLLKVELISVDGEVFTQEVYIRPEKYVREK